jgi:hypothetical protein
MSARAKRAPGSRRLNGESWKSDGRNAKGYYEAFVWMGTKSDGTADRRHVERRTEAARNKAVRELEKKRNAGQVGKPGLIKTVKSHARPPSRLGSPPTRPSAEDGHRLPVALRESDLSAVGRPAHRPPCRNSSRTATGTCLLTASPHRPSARCMPSSRARTRSRSGEATSPAIPASSSNLRGSLRPTRPRSANCKRERS